MKDTRETKRKIKEAPVYTAQELASRICKKYNVSSDLALVALAEGGKAEYTIREAETLISGLKERKVR